MVEKGINVGGEQSGHMILTDYSTTGDGLVAAMQVIAMVKKLGRPVSEVCRRFEPLPQVLRNVRFKGGRPLEDDNVVKAIAAAREKLGDQRPARHPPLRHRAGDPGDGRSRRPLAGRHPGGGSVRRGRARRRLTRRLSISSTAEAGS